MSRPTADDRVEALRRFLAGLSRGDDANQLVVDTADLHVRHNTFPGEVLMEVAADALDTTGVERETGAVHRELLSTHLPEVEFRVSRAAPWCGSDPGSARSGRCSRSRTC